MWHKTLAANNDWHDTQHIHMHAQLCYASVIFVGGRQLSGCCIGHASTAHAPEWSMLDFVDQRQVDKRTTWHHTWASGCSLSPEPTGYTLVCVCIMCTLGLHMHVQAMVLPMLCCARPGEVEARVYRTHGLGLRGSHN